MCFCNLDWENEDGFKMEASVFRRKKHFFWELTVHTVCSLSKVTYQMIPTVKVYSIHIIFAITLFTYVLDIWIIFQKIRIAFFYIFRGSKKWPLYRKKFQNFVLFALRSTVDEKLYQIFLHFR